MLLTKEKKDKLKKVLLALSSDEEKDKISQQDMLASLINILGETDKKTEERFAGMETKFDELVDLLEKNKTTLVKHNSVLLQSVNDFSDSLTKKLDEVKELSKVVKGDVFGPDKAKDSNFAAFDRSGKKLKDSNFTVDGTRKLTVSSLEPENPEQGDLWVRT